VKVTVSIWVCNSSLDVEVLLPDSSAEMSSTSPSYRMSWLTLLLHIWDVLDSNLGLETSCRDWDLSWIFSVPPGKCQNNALKLGHDCFLPNLSQVILHFHPLIWHHIVWVDRLCGLVVSVADYKHRGPGFDSRALLRIFLRELVLEWGPLSLMIG
jgi:hypothetical protein